MEEMGYFNEKEYIEGFNLGYKISKEVPELGELIYSAKGVSNKLEGLKDGRQQYLEDQLVDQKNKEKFNDKSKSFLISDQKNKIPRIAKNKSQEIDPEI